MTVIITKPAVNLREELASLNKPSGIVGESILRANTAADAVEQLNLEDHTFTTFTSTGIDDNATSTKFTVSDTGIDVTGTVTADGLTVDGPFTSKGIDDNAAATAMTLDASGNVGIGTSSFVYATAGRGIVEVNGSSSALVALKVGDYAKAYWYSDGTNVEFKGLDGALLFGSGASGTERMRIDASGNVGIGTTTPNTKMDIIGSTTGASGIVDTLRLRNTGTTQNDGAKIQFTAGSSTSGAGIGSGGVALNSADLRFYSGGNTERMRIDASGVVTIGDNPINTSSNGFSSSGGVQNSSRSSTLVRDHYQFFNPNGAVGRITTTNSSTAYNTTSDYRLKENITPVQGAADIVKAMRPVTYNFKADSTDWHDGFLAHELQELHPRAVTGEKDAMQDEEYEVTPAVLDDDGNVVTEAVMGTRSVPDYQGVDYSKLTPILTAALQEALNKIDALEARLAALEGA